jgi:hypothetical protein
MISHPMKLKTIIDHRLNYFAKYSGKSSKRKPTIKRITPSSCVWPNVLHISQQTNIPQHCNFHPDANQIANINDKTLKNQS